MMMMMMMMMMMATTTLPAEWRILLLRKALRLPLQR